MLIKTGRFRVLVFPALNALNYLQGLFGGKKKHSAGQFSSSFGPLSLYLNDVLAFMGAHGRKEWAVLGQDIHYLSTVRVIK